MESSQIRKFFENQTIFLTGGSGFLGKILIEKLLRECNVAKIYVLIRSKKGKTSEERMEQFFNFPCFDRLKESEKNVFDKIRFMSGDCLEPLLGLSDQDIDTLIKETNVVIHAAANVKFEQSLKEATLNVRATRDVLELSKKMNNLKVLVYVSTAYSNCIYSHIKEDFYPPMMKAEKLFALVNSLDDETFEALTPLLLKDCPNTYIFSKSIAEDLVRAACGFLPIAVVRPAIVTGTICEPMPGWIDNFYGAVGIVAGAALGVIRSLHAKPDATAHIVPADYIANFVLAAAWKNSTPNNPIIYNFVGHKNSQMTWGQFMKTIEPHCWNAASDKIVWYFCFKIRENRIWHKICVFFLHTVFAHVADCVLFCIGRPTLAVKNYQRLDKMLDLISYFSTRNWEFDYDHVLELWKGMNDEDKKVFQFDMEQVDWEKYAHDSCFGARKYLLKDTSETLDKGRRKVRILFVVHYLTLALWWFLVYKFVMFLAKFFYQ